MRVEVQVPEAKPARRVLARGQVPAAKLSDVASRMRESPLREQLERMSGRETKRGK